MKKLLPEKLFSILVMGLILPVSPAQAETGNVNWYTVEVVSFTRAKTAQVQERWPVSAVVENPGISPEFIPLPNPDAATAEEPASLPMLEIVPVQAAEKQLGRHAYAINRAPGMSVTSHQIWRQKGLPRDLAPWINLETETPALSGKVRISLSRYLHADVDIQLLNPDWSPSYSNEPVMDDAIVARGIEFNVSRKLKRDKLHYIDHPLAGVLLRIERFEKDKELTEPEEMDSPISEPADEKSTT
jgi:hypothetical protein